jgi:NYN domain/OST-HTH/LOTUS domain
MGVHVEQDITDSAQVAVYIDFDNVVMSRYDQLHGPKSFRNDKASARNPTPVARQRLREARINFGAIMDYAATIGPVAISRAYADWSRTVNSDYGPDMIRSSIDLVQLFPASGTKNGADIRLAIDVIDDLSRYPYVSHVVVVAGDSDYISLAQRCKRLGRRVVGIGMERSVARYWEAACDEFQFYESVATAANSDSAAVDDVAGLSEEPRPDEEESDSLLVRAARLLYAKDSDADWIAAAGLKSLMKRLSPAFNESTQGFRSFTDFLKAHAALVDVKSTESGTMVHLRERGELSPELVHLLPPVPADDDTRRTQNLGVRRPVTPEIEKLALHAIRFAWQVCDLASPEAHTTLPSPSVRSHLLDLGAEPDAAKTAARVALTYFPVLLRDNEMRLQPNPELVELADDELLSCVRGGMADRIRADPGNASLAPREIAETVHGTDVSEELAAEYETLCSHSTLQEMMDRIGTILLPPQILWDVAYAFASVPDDIPLASAEALRRELQPYLQDLERDPESISFDAAHQTLAESGLILPQNGGSLSRASGVEDEVSAAIISEWSRRCERSRPAWHWEPFYQLTLPDKFHVGWRKWVRDVVEAA